jgi:peptidase M1-like protein
MNHRFPRTVSCGILFALGTPLAAQTTAKMPERGVRRDIPLTNSIRRAFAAGTRDSTGRPGRNYWQLRTDYTIRAQLDPATSVLTGRETIALYNASDSALTGIQMRLDQNIFLPTVPRGASTPSETTDGMKLTRLVVNGEAVSLVPPQGAGRGGRGGGAPAAPAQSFATGLSTTSARIALARPIPAKGSATLEIDWNFKLAGGPNGGGHRMTARWADTLYQVTQWYPRVAVYDDLRGWDSDAYLGPSEFYNNFGKFDVSIDVPGGWIVGATGVLQNPQDVLTSAARERLSHVLESDSVRTIVGPNEAGPGIATAAGDRLTWHFVADTVNDFAWVTAKKFVWDATRATIPERRPIPVNLLYLPGRAQFFADAGPITRHALEFYSKMWLPDPFAQITVADGPDQGMEYPMIIMSNRGAADHETGHQWWPMTVSNNETWYGWMDEGFNQYMNILSDADAAGQAPVLDGRGQSYGRTSGDEREPAMMYDANYGGPLYSFQTYSKTPLMLSMLGGIVGDSAVWRAQREFAHTWRFKHPSPWDYMYSMSRSLNRDLGWFWYYWLFSSESVDGSIQRVTSTASRTTVTVRQDGAMPSPVVLKVQFATSGPAIRTMPNAKMVDATTALVTWPVDVWFGGSRTFNAELAFGGRKIEKITLDPGRRFPDHDVNDNVWPRTGGVLP